MREIKQPDGLRTLPTFKNEFMTTKSIRHDHSFGQQIQSDDMSKTTQESKLLISQPHLSPYNIQLLLDENEKMISKENPSHDYNNNHNDKISNLVTTTLS